MSLDTITVIGAGTMGSGIAHVCAQFGKKVFLNDVSEKALKNALESIKSNLDRQIQKGIIDEAKKAATLANINITNKLWDAAQVSDMVIEAATECQELKEKIFLELDTACPAHTILASNTSSISITRIASGTSRPGKVIGMHFMNPVPIMKLVEVINGYATDKAVTDEVMEFVRSLGKIAVGVNDYPGFVANRILMPMINEAIYTLHEGVAKVDEIDTVMKLGMAHPMGPLQLADFIGLDVCLAILRVLHTGFGIAKYAPCPLLVNMVTAGYLGVKSGEGFYKYTPGSKDIIVSERFKCS